MSLPLILIGLAASQFFTKEIEQKKADAKSITLTPIDLQAKSAKDVQLVVQATNPSKTVFTIDSLSANVYYKNKVIGTIERPNPFTIKPTDNSLIKLSVATNVGEAVATLISLLFNKKEPKTLKVLGAYKYMGLSFPIDKTITLNA